MKTQGKDYRPEVRGAERARERTGLFDILHKDHKKVRELFKKIQKSGNRQVEIRQELFTELEQELLIHMEAEERFFYTALEQHNESRPKALESYEEHRVAKTVIGSFNSLAVDDERWPAKLRVLSRFFRQHVDEEEHQLFKLSKKVLDNDQFMGIAAKVQELRREAKKVCK